MSDMQARIEKLVRQGSCYLARTPLTPPDDSLAPLVRVMEAALALEQTWEPPIYPAEQSLCDALKAFEEATK